jgi:hypothetical protein
VAELGDRLLVPAEDEQLGARPTHDFVHPARSIPIVPARELLAFVVDGVLLVSLPSVRVVGLAERSSTYPRRVLELAHVELVDPGLLAIGDDDAVAVRLVEDGEERAQVGRRVDHGAVTYQARHHDLLVQARVFAREDADAVTFELAGAVRHFEDTVEVVSE